MDTIKLRQDFLNYFRENNHRFMVQSKVYNNDPTLMFINAGMNQLKDIFLGIDEPKINNNIIDTKLMNYQICIRAGGKHNDLDDVGYDSYHLTLFEMLGNWSLDDYWKEKTIELSYNFLINICKLDPDRLYVTYYSDPSNKCPIDPDIESKNIWKKYVPDGHILQGSAKDNFWMMGDSGPCGPCTEIHYDLIGNRDASNLVNMDDPTVIEIWNMVFIEYNKIGDDYHKLDKRYVDTGMGLERLSMILQNRSTIFQTDVFRYIIGCAQYITNAEYYADSYDKNCKKDIAYRIFADHIRTVVICLYQGVKFGSNNKEYVLRKIFRRLLEYTYLYLNENGIDKIMNDIVIKSIISKILNYFLFKKHNADIIWQQMIAEEELYYKKIVLAHRKYINRFKKLNDHDKVKNLLKQSFGIDYEISDIIKEQYFS